MIYKVLAIITNGDPQDVQSTIDEIVVSSFKPISFLVICIQNKAKDHMDQEIDNFDEIKKLSENLVYSKTLDLYQARRNIIYHHYIPPPSTVNYDLTSNYAAEGSMHNFSEPRSTELDVLKGSLVTEWLNIENKLHE